ncbi:hypothetical protein [Microcoleus sp. FACHB-672]|uniref:hypothetical protein n=1 Tax=Microcoleus sp. FACHB-672 TaxID=2692825 RepID=UPI00168982AF|nr:hypothetical protein [Microcoleus sp. FACHB-672]MBD2039695.1 hypothetical protein [Microcoleus sp. FACHB-672]
MTKDLTPALELARRNLTAKRQELGKQLHTTLRGWYELVENRQLFSTQPFEELEESEKEILGRCAAQMQQTFTKEDKETIGRLQKDITTYRQLAFNICEGLSQVSVNGTHRQKSEAIQQAISMLLPVARPLIFPTETPLNEIPF